MKIIASCVDKFHDYVVFCKSIFFILGLVFSCKLVESLFLGILITHLAADCSLRKAAIIVNLREGICAVAVLLFAFMADAYSGLFKMVVCSTTLCIIGMLLTFFAAWDADGFLDLRLLYPALVILTLSEAAEMITLKSFLGDQLVPRDRRATQEEEEKAQSRCKFWWYLVSFVAAIFTLFGPLRSVSFRNLAMILAIVVGAAFLWFLLGIKFYRCVEPTDSPLSNVVLVIRTAITKRNVVYPENPGQLFENSSGLEQIQPHVSWLRWLDRAAVVQESPAGHICTVEQVKGVKFLLKMLPMWSTFLTFNLVAASGSTFFIEEADSITDNTFPILFFCNLRRFIEFMISEISDYVLEKLGKKKPNIAQRMMLGRIGIGMICCVLCCIAAWANANHRLQADIMNVYRLTPQFLLLALMEGLSQDGLRNFFNSQVSKSICRYGLPFGECVMGVGKFLSVVCILLLSRWFKWFADEVNNSRLDLYYKVLAILSSVNIILYCVVARWYGDETFLLEDEVDIEMDNAGQADPRSRVESPGPVESGRNVHGQEQNSSGYNLTENTNSEQSQTHEDSRLPLLKLETGQNITSSSSTVFLADNRRNDHEAEELKADIFESTYQVSPLVSESTMYGPSDAAFLRGARSFPRPSSQGLIKRFRTIS